MIGEQDKPPHHHCDEHQGELARREIESSKKGSQSNHSKPKYLVEADAAFDAGCCHASFLERAWPIAIIFCVIYRFIDLKEILFNSGEWSDRTEFVVIGRMTEELALLVEIGQGRCFSGLDVLVPVD